jgi:thiol:disulfide interchange protein
MTALLSIVLLLGVATGVDVLFGDLVSSAQAGEWMAAVGALIGLMTFGLRLLLSWKVPWFKTRLGGLTLVFGIAFLFSISASLRAGTGASLTMLMVALSAAWTATGIHTHVKDAQAYLKSRKTT